MRTTEGARSRAWLARSCFLLLGFAVLIIFFASNPAFSENKGAVSDFGAETIDPPEVQKQVVVPLPVELVEERGIEDASTPQQKKEAAKPKASTEAETETIPDLSAKTTVLNVTDGEISALIKTFSKLTKRNYIVDSSVKGKVTVHFPSEVTVEEALRIFESVLLLKGFTTVPVSENVWKVIPAKDAKQTTIPTVKGAPTEQSDALVTELVRLRHIPSQDMQQIISQFVSKEGMISAVATTNSLIIIDSSANIKRLKDITSQLDVPALDQEITIIPVTYADATDIADKINQILGEEKEQGQNTGTVSQTPIATTRPGAPATPRPATSQTSSSSGRSDSRRALPLKIIPDERTNSLIVVADPELTLKVRALADQLDSEVDRSGGGFWVYRLKHANAEDLADVLSGLISGSGVSTSSKTKSEGSSISRSQSSRYRDSSSSSRSRFGLGSSNTEARSTQRQGTGAQTTGGAGVQTGKVNLEGEVSIAPDTGTNSLIINASRSDYQRLKEVIEALDIKRRQVLVEATILEVTINKSEGMGVELQGTTGTDSGAVVGQTNFGNLSNLLTNPSALSDLTIAAASTGTLTLPGGLTIPSQALLISAVSTNDNVNVLSTPTIVATDNEEAEIIVGQNVPFISSTSTNSSNLSNTFNSIERQDVGITLRITPQISSSEYVSLKIFVEISNVVAGTENAANGPTTTIRTTETQVEVKDGQMVISGGLIQDSVTDSTRGVPFFQDIPVIGQLLKRQDTTRNRTNLLLFITPRILSDQYQLRDETKSASQTVENEIISKEVEPDRRETLNSENMDRVVEAAPKDLLTPPTTITPPTKSSQDNESAEDRALDTVATERTLARLNSLATPTKTDKRPSEPMKEETLVGDTSNSAESEEVIDIRVTPTLPGAQEIKTQVAPATEDKVSGTDKRSGNKTSKTYVVLRQLSGTGTPPFKFADKEKSVGIVVPGSLTSLVGRFFEVGRRYRLKTGEGRLEFICLGVYGSPSEAGVVHPALANSGLWYNLSPEETFSLGKKSWIKS